jgi:hypothetical protein
MSPGWNFFKSVSARRRTNPDLDINKFEIRKDAFLRLFRLCSE